jgi:hypothetical protein
MEPHVMAIGAFLLVAGTLFAIFGIPYYVDATFGTDSMTGAVDSAILIAAVGAAVLAYGVGSPKSEREAGTKSGS